jgi:uncharacterized protein (UPF0276 family)
VKKHLRQGRHPRVLDCESRQHQIEVLPTKWPGTAGLCRAKVIDLASQLPVVLDGVTVGGWRSKTFSADHFESCIALLFAATLVEFCHDDGNIAGE